MPQEIRLWLFFLWSGAYEYILWGYTIFTLGRGDQPSGKGYSYLYDGYFIGVDLFVPIRIFRPNSTKFIWLEHNRGLLGVLWTNLGQIYSNKSEFCWRISRKKRILFPVSPNHEHYNLDFVFKNAC